MLQQNQGNDLLFQKINRSNQKNFINFSFIILSHNFKMPDFQNDSNQQQQWIVVTKNKKKHKGNLNNKVIHNKGNQNIFEFQKYKDEIINQFINSKAFIQNKRIILSNLYLLKKNKNINQIHIECLGLGNFLSNKKSFIQLLFLQKLILECTNEINEKQKQKPLGENKQEQIQRQTINLLTINMYDPAFTLPQINYIKNNFVPKTKIQQKFQIKEEYDKLNIFFMPHCQRNLYEEVYKQYFKIKSQKLQNSPSLLVIGNSIEQYKDRCKLINEKIPEIFLHLHLNQEKLVDYENALNDTFILF